MDDKALLSYPKEGLVEDFWHHHKLTLRQGKFVKRYHCVAFAVAVFGVAIYLGEHQFTFGIIVARCFDAMGDLFVDRGFGGSD